METRIKDFMNKEKDRYAFSLLSNRNLRSFFWKSFIHCNYHTFLWAVKDLFSYRNYAVIESNGHRDRILAILNYLLYYPFYRLNKTSLYLVLHWVQGIKENNWITKIIYDSILYRWFLVSWKIIFVSPEVRDFFLGYFPSIKKIIKTNSEIVVNYIWPVQSSDSTNSKRSYKTVKNVLLVSRIDQHKSRWIQDAMEFCATNKINLEIYWWWTEKERLEQTYPGVVFHWEVINNQIPYYHYDCILWMWRALLEWIMEWLPGILCWYDRLMCVTRSDSIDTLSYSNFSGRWVIPVAHEPLIVALEKHIATKDYHKTTAYIKEHYSIEHFTGYR